MKRREDGGCDQNLEGSRQSKYVEHLFVWQEVWGKVAAVTATAAVVTAPAPAVAAPAPAVVIVAAAAVAVAALAVETAAAARSTKPVSKIEMSKNEWEYIVDENLLFFF